MRRVKKRGREANARVQFCVSTSVGEGGSILPSEASEEPYRMNLRMYPLVSPPLCQGLPCGA